MGDSKPSSPVREEPAPYHDVTDAEAHGNLHHNPDPALDPAHQHHHAHHHHSPRVDAAGGHDDAVYTTGTTPDANVVPDQHHQGGDRHAAAALDDEKKAVVSGASSGSATHLPGYAAHDKAAEAGVSQHQRHNASSEDEEDHAHRHKDTRHLKLLFIVLLIPFLAFTGWWISALVQFQRAEYWFVLMLVWTAMGMGLIYFSPHRRAMSHLVVFMLFTGWWIASLILHRNDKNWIVPFLLWLAITLRLIFFHVPIRYVSRILKFTWSHTVLVVYNLIPAKFRTLAGAAGAIAVILVGSFVSPEEADNTRENRAVSLFGLAVLIFAFWVTSKHRSSVNWRTVIVGMLAQYIIGLFVLRTEAGYDIFKFIADRAGDLLGFAGDGVAFLTDADTAKLGWFFIGVVPAIIFFISLVQVLYYFGFIQWFIKKVATFVFWGLGVSGAEAVVAAATPFIGQGESAMLVRPFVSHMTKAELHQILTCGFATISGSVLVGYIGLGLNAEALVSSCIMSIPASLAISKLRYPETEETLTAGRVVIPDDDEHKAENALHAFANGTWLGIKIGGSIVASLLCIIAFVGLINGLLTWWGRYINLNNPDLTLQMILSFILYPVSFLLGVPRDGDLLKVAKLIAEKVITNEYNAFTALSTDTYYADLSPRSQLIATYALCGFGNIGSLGIQIGILSQLAPSRGGDVSKLAFSALVSGVFSTLSSASVAGLVVTSQLSHFTKPTS